MCGFVQRVELQPAPGVNGGPLQCAVGDARRDQPLQSAGERLPELLAHRRLPFLELRTAAQGEPGQEVVPVQRGRPLERGGVRTADHRAELAHVDPDQRRIQRHGRPADAQPVAHRRGRHRQRAPQRRPALGAVRLGPEQVGQLLAAVLAPGHREQREQRRRLPGVEGDRRSVPPHHRRPEQGQAEVRRCHPSAVAKLALCKDVLRLLTVACTDRSSMPRKACTRGPFCITLTVTVTQLRKKTVGKA